MKRNKNTKRNYLIRYRNISVDRFEIIRFFSYTSTIPADRTIVEIDHNNYKSYPCICDKFSSFYDELAKKATAVYKEKTGEVLFYRFNDNKTVFQVRDTYTGNVWFISRYDMRCAIGKSAYLYDGRIVDLVNGKMSEYMSDVYADTRGMFVKFEL